MITDDFIENNYSIPEIWDILRSPPLIAGPWVPCNGEVWVFNAMGQPIAKASSQKEMSIEELHLKSLGWKLTDPDRKVPTHWFKNSSEFKYEDNEDDDDEWESSSFYR